MANDAKKMMARLGEPLSRLRGHEAVENARASKYFQSKSQKERLETKRYDPKTRTLLVKYHGKTMGTDIDIRLKDPTRGQEIIDLITTINSECF